MGLHMGFESGAGCAGQLLLEAVGVPGPESSHLRMMISFPWYSLSSCGRRATPRGFYLPRSCFASAITAHRAAAA